MLFKDEVRQLGRELGLAGLPGHGASRSLVRALPSASSARSPRKSSTSLRDADAIFREEIAKAGLDRSINQYFAVLTSMRSVGVMGDCPHL